jgi:hypothetical protein
MFDNNAWGEEGGGKKGWKQREMWVLNDHTSRLERKNFESFAVGILQLQVDSQRK